MKELNEEWTEVENKKLEDYIVKEYHENGSVDISINIRQMVKDLLGERKTVIGSNKIYKITFVKPRAMTDPFGRLDETSVYLVNRSEDEIRKIFENILKYEDEDRINSNSNIKMTLRAYVMEEGKEYLEKTERGLTVIKNAELIDGRNTARI
jgi:hypothetical protein